MNTEQITKQILVTYEQKLKTEYNENKTNLDAKKKEQKISQNLVKFYQKIKGKYKYALIFSWTLAAISLLSPITLEVILGIVNTKISIFSLVLSIALGSIGASFFRKLNAIQILEYTEKEKQKKRKKILETYQIKYQKALQKLNTFQKNHFKIEKQIRQMVKIKPDQIEPTFNPTFINHYFSVLEEKEKAKQLTKI